MTTEEEALPQTEPTAGLIYERFGSLIVGEGTDDVAEGLFAQLARTDSTLATAESCTGGLIAQKVTAIAGVSPYYLGGAVTYSNESKGRLLGVPAELIAAHGAVSPEVAAAMAEGARTRLGATIGISTTGIAGPGGGTPEKPVGLVYLGLSTAERYTDPPTRHGSGTAPRFHPDLLGQGGAQLGEVGAAGREIVRPALRIR